MSVSAEDLLPLGRYRVSAEGRVGVGVYLGTSPTPCLLFRRDDSEEVWHFHGEELSAVALDFTAPSWLPTVAEEAPDD